MLDPFTAVSLAGNILQFVNLGHSILVKSREIYRSGSTEASRQLEIVTKDLTALTHEIDKEASQCSISNGSLSTEDQALQDLAGQTLAVAQQLLALLDQIKVAQIERGKLESIRRALKSAVNENKIHELEQRLASLRSELILRVLVSMRTGSAAQAIRHDSRLDSLSSSLQVTIRDILDGNVTLLSEKIDQSTTKLTSQQQNHHEEILQALSGISNSCGLSSQRAQLVEFDELTEKRARKTEDFILQQLTFREISDRADSTYRAHEATFKWIFEEDSAPDENWSNFVQWLRGNSNLYWIRGKAGSGKSTLMKYLSASDRTIESLKTWAADSTLHVASFHFWSLGTALQRSQEGLLRALLLSLLSKHRGLLKDSMPGYYTDVCRMLASDIQTLAPQPLSLIEIKAAFTRAVKAFSSQAYACIFIDGLDEYEGNVTELLELFLPVISEKFKIVVSSRPIPSCLTALQDYPQLRLEDLTRLDILSYAKQKLESHPNAVRLKQHYKVGLHMIIEELVERSSGVFLWVVLVVRILLKSLDSGDSVEELSQQLDALPTELGPFYKHMMDNMEPSYRIQASWYLQMVLRSIEVQLQHPLNLIQCFLAEFYGEERVFPHSDQDLNDPLNDPLSSFWVESALLMEHRLVSRCCGLVEALGHTDHHGFHTVAFVHKSVADFLRLPHIWEYLIDLTKERKSEINFVLGRSLALHTKIMWPKRRLEEAGRVISSGQMAYTSYCLKYLRDGESRANRISLRAFKDLSLFAGSWACVSDNYMYQFYQAVPRAVNCSTNGNALRVPAVVLDPLSDAHAELLLAACAGLQLHFQLMHKNRNLTGPKAASEVDNQLLRIVVGETSLTNAWKKGYLNEQLEIIRYLIRNGCDPNWKPADGISSWELLLRNFGCSERLRADDESLVDIDDNERSRDERLSACIDLIFILLRGCCQTEDARIANHLIRMKEDALRRTEKIIKRMSPADRQLNMKATQARTMLLEISEQTKTTEPPVQGKRLFGKIFSWVTK